MRWVRVTGDGVYDGSRFLGRLGQIAEEYTDEGHEYVIDFAPASREISRPGENPEHPFYDQWDVFLPGTFDQLEGDWQDDFDYQALLLIME
jgi:hypothetical protein